MNGDGTWVMRRARIDLGSEEVGLGGAGGVVDDELGAEGSEVEGNGSADSTGAASDNNNSVMERKGLGCLLESSA